MTQRKPDPFVQWRWRLSRAMRSRRFTLLDVLVVALLVGCLYGRSWLADLQPASQYPPPVADLMAMVNRPYPDALTATRAAMEFKSKVEALGPHKDATVKALLAVLHRDRNSARQWMATMALEEIGPAAAPAVPSLTRLVADSKVNPGLRLGATNALGAIGPAAVTAVPVLTDIVADRSAKASLRRDAAKALGAIGPGARRAVSALTAALADADPQLRSSAADGLEGIGPAAASAVPSLIVALDDNEWLVGTSAADALGAIGPDAGEAVFALVAMLQRTGPATGGSLERVEKAIPLIREKFTRDQAEATGQMLDMLRNGGARVIVRSSAARALGNIGPPARAAVPALGTALRHKDPGVRMATAYALGLMGSVASDAIGELTETLDDENDKVRQAAREALESIRLAEPRRPTP